MFIERVIDTSLATSLPTTAIDSEHTVSANTNAPKNTLAIVTPFVLKKNTLPTTIPKSLYCSRHI